MKAFKEIRDPRAFQLLADETRRRIVYLLRAKERTVSQIADELNLTPQAIYHHIRKLRDADMVEVAREERVDHFIETYYRATAEVFQLSHGEGKAQRSELEHTKMALECIGKLGIDFHVDKDLISKIVDVTKKMKQFGYRPEWTEKISECEDVDFFAKQTLVEYMHILSMTDQEFEELLRHYRELRRLLRSGVVQSGRPKKK
ncbi:MAG: ArsR/SmtB family transcription factor [Thermoplasmata archaeon]